MPPYGYVAIISGIGLCLLLFNAVENIGANADHLHQARIGVLSLILNSPRCSSKVLIIRHGIKISSCTLTLMLTFFRAFHQSRNHVSIHQYFPTYCVWQIGKA